MGDIEHYERLLLAAMHERALANAGERDQGPTVRDMAEQVAAVAAEQHRGAVEALRVLALAAEGVLNDAEGQPRKVLREALRAAHTRFGGQ